MSELRPSLILFLLLTLLTGVVYPAVVTLIAQGFFPWQANGSVMIDGGRVMGSEHIGQVYADDGHFWGRPSATTPPYNASASSGSNLAPGNPALLDAMRQRIGALQAADPGNRTPVPVDLVTASGSGLDPDISPAAAFYQVARVARARHVDARALREWVTQQVQCPQWGVLGQARIHVVALNRALDAWDGHEPSAAKPLPACLRHPDIAQESWPAR